LHHVAEARNVPLCLRGVSVHADADGRRLAVDELVHAAPGVARVRLYIRGLAARHLVNPVNQVTNLALVEPCRTCLLFQLARGAAAGRSEEHTSELQSRENLVCRLLLEKKRTHAERHPAAAY